MASIVGLDLDIRPTKEGKFAAYVDGRLIGVVDSRFEAEELIKPHIRWQ